MNYIVFDLEFNQAFNFGNEHKKTSDPRCPFEIIQIGAVKLDENLNIAGKLNSLVKPKLYVRLHPYVKKMTGITKSGLNTGKPFKSVYKEFCDLVTDSSVLCVWGTSDIHELFRNAEYHKVDTSLIPLKYIDIQRYANMFLNHPKGTSIGLSAAAEMLNIPPTLQFHNAFNDAYYTAEVFKRVYNDKIKPDDYQLHRYRIPGKQNIKNGNVDTERIVRRFEKIFKRQMTKEEQSIIMLAYRMGSTSQIQKQ